ncbi:MAG: 2Fe-2S iron-sulfur cluster-binding protein [Pyrinomonadaceae bacterium]|nr:2Fe-2S iron-sulfur cluster-binding protein [Pyrinomonadaceae bacterium]
MSNAYFDSISKYAEADWLTAVESLAPSVHEVDRAAVQIWFRFYPLDLERYLAAAENPEEAMRGLALQGDFGLADKIDTSHRFLYGHRYWPQAKAAIEARAASGEQFGDIASEIKAVAKTVADAAKANESLTLSIAAAGLYTLAHVGLDAFKAASGIAAKPAGIMAKSPDAIVAERAKDDSQGMFGFLKTVDKKFSVIRDEYTGGRFPVINEEDVASASQKDHSQDWQSMDDRCWDGPVPIECTSASCGTCWVGVLGGAEKLTEPSARERKQMKVFGYNQPDDAKPYLRLACQAKATGNVTIVIPPWNAVFGKKVRGNVEDVELEPATTSAKRLRSVVQDAISSNLSLIHI